MVPSPGCYLVHKFLTLKRRDQLAKKEKDAFYIFDILNRFESNWEFLVSEIAQTMKAFDAYKEVRSFTNDFSEFFKEPTSEGILLIMSEYNRTYVDEFDLSDAQAVAFIQSFIQKLSMLYSTTKISQRR